MSQSAAGTPQTDVVDLLLRQHQDVRRLFDELESGTAETRRDAFDALRRLLAVHETAEEEVVHPAARLTSADAEAVVDARLEEEDKAKNLLAELEGLDVDSTRFVILLGQLRTAVLAHAEREEREEFPLLRSTLDEEQRSRLATAVQAVEQMASGQGGALAEGGAASVLVGTYAVMIERTRAVLRGGLPGPL